jgi:hypothetical protein
MECISEQTILLAQKDKAIEFIGRILVDPLELVRAAPLEELREPNAIGLRVYKVYQPLKELMRPDVQTGKEIDVFAGVRALFADPARFSTFYADGKSAIIAFMRVKAAKGAVKQILNTAAPLLTQSINTSLERDATVWYDSMCWDPELNANDKPDLVKSCSQLADFLGKFEETYKAKPTRDLVWIYRFLCRRAGEGDLQLVEAYQHAGLDLAAALNGSAPK